MSILLVNADRDTPMMFPASVQELLSENHKARFIVEAIEEIDLSAFKVNRKGSGDEQYASGMMPMLLYTAIRRGYSVRGRWTTSRQCHEVSSNSCEKLVIAEEVFNTA